MRQSQLTQSRYYSPAFNAAIFDGPVRIYFAQHQEPAALQVYFRLQGQMGSWAPAAARLRLPNIFVMLYPTAEIFSHSFSPEQCGDEVVIERLGDDFVVGACGPLTDALEERLLTNVHRIVDQGLTSLKSRGADLALA